MARVELKVQLNTDRLENALQGKIMDSRTGYAVHNLLAKMCDPYVPFLEGPLSQTFAVQPDKLVYIQPYARYQYYGTHFKHTLDYHPKASAMWDKAMMNEKGDEFRQQVKDILVQALNDGRIKDIEE